MKLEGIATLCLAGFALAASAQTHIEGEEYYKAGQYDNAQDLLLRSLKNPQSDKSVSDYYLGCIAIVAEKPADAKKYFTEGTQANAENPYNYVGLGQLELAAGNTKAAQQLFKQAESYSKKDASLAIAIARAYYDVDPVKYEKEILKFSNNARKYSKDTNPNIYLFEGDQAKDRKDFGKAGSMYEMATSYDASFTPAYVKYAQLFKDVNPDHTINLLEGLIQTNPSSALGLHEIAERYYEQGKYADAVKAYGKYINNPNHFKKDESRYAFLLFYDKQYKNAYDYASKLLAEDPQNFTAQRYQFMNAAQLPEMKDQLLPLAEKLYATHMADPAKNKFAPVDYNLVASELLAAKRVDDAIEVLKEAVKEMPENADMSKQLAFAYLDANNLSPTADAYNDFIIKSEQPGYNDFIQQATFDYYAGIENQEKDPAKAASYFDNAKKYALKAAEILPDNYKPVMIQGDLLKQMASKDQASSAAQPLYEKAVVLLEKSADPSKYARDAKTIYNYLGNFYLDKKDVAKAKEYFNKYLQYDPNNADYRKFVEGLK